MNRHRHACLSIAFLCLCVAAPINAQNPAAPQQPAPPQSAPQQPAPSQEKKPANPFEEVPETPQNKPAEAPQQPRLETPKPAEQPKNQPAAGPVIEAIIFQGARRVPQDTLRQLITTKKGDIYNEDELHRDFMSLWNSGRF